MPYANKPYFDVLNDDLEAFHPALGAIGTIGNDTLAARQLVSNGASRLLARGSRYARIIVTPEEEQLSTELGKRLLGLYNSGFRFSVFDAAPDCCLMAEPYLVESISDKHVKDDLETSPVILTTGGKPAAIGKDVHARTWYSLVDDPDRNFVAGTFMWLPGAVKARRLPDSPTAYACEFDEAIIAEPLRLSLYASPAEARQGFRSADPAENTWFIMSHEEISDRAAELLEDATEISIRHHTEDTRTR